MHKPAGAKITKQPVSVHRLKKHPYASRESVRTLSGFLSSPLKNPRAFRGRKVLTPPVQNEN